jgi:hypothetical protein
MSLIEGIIGPIASLIDKIIPDPQLSIKKGGLAPLGAYKRSWIFDKINGTSEGKYTILLSGCKSVGKTSFGCWFAKKINLEFTKFINIDKMIGLDE